MSDQFENDGPYQDAVSAEEIERRIMDSQTAIVRPAHDYFRLERI
jgi:hypothetical protein